MTQSSIDWQEFKQRYQQNLQLGHEIMTMFIHELPEQIDAIIDFQAQANFQAMQSATHQLHGAACYACVPTLALLLDKIEAALKQKNYPLAQDFSQALPQEVTQIQAAYQSHAESLGNQTNESIDKETNHA